MPTTPAESAAELRELAHAATRDFAALQASAPLDLPPVEVDLDEVAASALRLLQATAVRLLRPEEFDYLVDEALAGISDTQCIDEFMRDPSRAAYTPRETNAKQLVWVYRHIGPSVGEPAARGEDFDWWGASVRTLRDVQEAFCKRIVEAFPVVGFDVSEQDRDARNEVLSAFSKFLLGWLRVVCPFGEMDTLLLAVSDYGDS